MSKKHSFLIHAGMMKTGSTSIQEAWCLVDTPSHAYFDWGGINHSGPLTSAYLSDVAWQKLKTEGRAEKAAQSANEFERGVNRARAGSLLISAEVMSNSAMVKTNTRFRDAILPHADSIRVLAYARPALGYIGSMYLQRLKMGKHTRLSKPFLFDGLLALDDVFGEDSVEMRFFSREKLIDGDVVSDACEWAGTQVPVLEYKEANVSPKRELAGILLVHAMMSRDRKNTPRMRFARKRILSLVDDFGEHAFKLSSDAVKSYRDRLVPDLEKLSDRIGSSLNDLDGPVSDHAISSEAELLTVGIEKAPDFLDFLQTERPHLSRFDRKAIKKALEVSAKGTSPRERATLVLDDLIDTFVAVHDSMKADVPEKSAFGTDDGLRAAGPD